MQDLIQKIIKFYQKTFNNLFKMKGYIMFIARKTQHHKHINSLQTDLQIYFNSNISVEHDKLILKCAWNNKGPRIYDTPEEKYDGKILLYQISRFFTKLK